MKYILYGLLAVLIIATPADAATVWGELSRTPVMRIIYVGIGITIIRFIAQAFKAGWFGNLATMVGMLYALGILIDQGLSIISKLKRLG